MGQLVVRRAQILVTGEGPEAGAVNHPLRMLDPHTQREGLGLHIDAAGVEALERVPGAMPKGEDHRIAGDLGPVLQHDAADPALVGRAVQGEVHHLALEPVLSPQRLDLGPHALDHADEAEGADVRMRFGQDFRRGAGGHELGQHLAA